MLPLKVLEIYAIMRNHATPKLGCARKLLRIRAAEPMIVASRKSIKPTSAQQHRNKRRDVFVEVQFCKELHAASLAFRTAG